MNIDIKKVAESGQCFRLDKVDNEKYRIIYRNTSVMIDRFPDIFKLSPELKTYLGLNINYDKILDMMRKYSPFTESVANFGEGLTLLSQDPWETLISFIISQRNSIPRIKNTVKALCNDLGKSIDLNTKNFPSPKDLLFADLSKYGLGYRDKYIKHAAEMIMLGTINLEDLKDYSDEEAIKELKKINGVGEKVARCTALYSLGHYNMVPVDVWINRVIEKEFNGSWPYEAFGKYNGIVQLYVFYFLIKNKSEFKYI